MSETPYYPPTASPRQQAGTGTPGPVLVAVAGPAAQRRATVAIRFILAVPHFLALYFLGIAAVAVVVIGWLGALVTGRLPRFAATYLSGYLRWCSRAGAYLFLLTDEYPPFAFGEAAYPVRLAVGSGRLNRPAVLFRIILAIPAAIVSILLTSGFTTIVIFIAWLTALIAGRLPASLHQAFATVFRYTIRYYGYLYLLTDAYPAGLFGDGPGAQTEAVSPPGGGPGYGTAVRGHAAPYLGYGSPAAGYTDYGPSGHGAPGYGTPWLPGHPAPETGASGQAASWQLVLSSGAKRLVGLILVLGLLNAAGEGAWVGAKINAIRQRDREISQLNIAVAQFNAVVARHNAAVAQEQQTASQVSNDSVVLSGAHHTLVDALNSTSADSRNCSTVNCFDMTSLSVAHAFTAFGHTLRATPTPPGSAAIAKRLITDTAGNEQDWMEMAQAASFTSIENIATAAEKVGGRFDNDYSALMKSLDNEATTLSNEAATLNNAATTLDHEAAALNQRAAALNVTVSVRAAKGDYGAAGTPEPGPGSAAISAMRAAPRLTTTTPEGPRHRP
jgi:hypothetical protein